jgi:DNA-directed RNA polymerase subunit RPC12/RpoP
MDPKMDYENDRPEFENLTLSSFITYTNTVDNPLHQARKVKYQILYHLKAFTSVMGIGNCSDIIRIYNPPDPNHQKLIAKPCGNRHACPVCSSRFMAKMRVKSVEIAQIHRANGGNIYQATFNQRYAPNTPMKKSLKMLTETWKLMGKSTAWRKLQKKYGVEGYIRIQESAHLPTGWFPHFHLQWFFSNAESESTMMAFSVEAAALWVKYSNDVGAVGTASANQFHYALKPGTERAQANYLFKHGYFDLKYDPLSVSAERDSLKPFEFLIHALFMGDNDLIQEWVDFEEATYRTIRVKISKSLKDKLP